MKVENNLITIHSKVRIDGGIGSPYAVRIPVREFELKLEIDMSRGGDADGYPKGIRYVFDEAGQNGGPNQAQAH